jgi:hypothetical protein
MATQEKADNYATLSMILGLTSFVCTCLTGIPAVVLGLMAWSDASPKGRFRAKIGIGGGALGLVVLVAFSVFGPHAPPPVPVSAPEATASAATTSTVPVESPAPKYTATVDAVTLWKAYDANEVSADDAYKGKSLLVTGKVSSITKDMFDNIVVGLASPNQFMDTHATMKDGEKSNAGRLSKGVTVKLICKCTGSVMGSPMLNECTFAR